MKLVEILPPIILKSRKKLLDKLIPERHVKKQIKNLQKETLFDGDDLLFKRLIFSSKVYAEIGCGQSTVYVCSLKSEGPEKVICVDSSNEWLKLVASLSIAKTPLLHHVDFGVLSDWGRPISYAGIDKVEDYAGLIFKEANPDLILIDGRFRVYCFCVCINLSEPGTKILFDDYVGRPYYSIIEKIIKPSETCGRQALFVRPDKIDQGLVESMIVNFKYVMD